MKRYLNLSHDDLDGTNAAANIFAAYRDFAGIHVTTKFVNHGNIHQKLHAALTEARFPFDRIILSDISFKVPGAKLPENVSNELKQLINYLIPKALHDYVGRGGQFVLIDHHMGANAIKLHYGSVLHPTSIVEVGSRAGSELAADYYLAERYPDSNPGPKGRYDNLLLDLARVSGDCDLWRNPGGDGDTLLMGIELMNDNHQAMYDMLGTIDTLSQGSRYPSTVWSRDMLGRLGQYVEIGKSTFGEIMSEASKTAIYHSDLVTEVFAPVFEDFVANKLYNSNHGVVIICKQNDRSKVASISLRSHANFPLHLGEFCTQYGGGGHKHASGMPIPYQSLDGVIAKLIKECHLALSRG
jgi:oligoribonuclease NrnB/cAMP/cGMP phosphodiesterase (DHH superfamily)